MKADQYFIVNTTDCPDERHVTEMRAKPGRGKKRGLYYLHPAFRDLSRFHGMKSTRPTSLAAFGFDVEVKKDGCLTTLTFAQVRKSTATYEDGTPRKWQGWKNFTIEL